MRTSEYQTHSSTKSYQNLEIHPSNQETSSCIQKVKRVICAPFQSIESLCAFSVCTSLTFMASGIITLAASHSINNEDSCKGACLVGLILIVSGLAECVCICSMSFCCGNNNYNSDPESRRNMPYII